MDGQQRDSDRSPLAFNPLFAFWALPFIMSQAWVTAWSGMGTKSIFPKGGSDISKGEPVAPKDDDGQIPVPETFQEKKDKELFA
ncbi:MAG: hypothetical protein ACSLE1_13655 [Sphingobium sp.]